MGTTTTDATTTRLLELLAAIDAAWPLAGWDYASELEELEATATYLMDADDAADALEDFEAEVLELAREMAAAAAEAEQQVEHLAASSRRTFRAAAALGADI
jgi:galactokinase